MRFEKCFGVGEKCKAAADFFVPDPLKRIQIDIADRRQSAIRELAYIMLVNGPHVADSDDTEFYLIHKSVLL